MINISQIYHQVHCEEDTTSASSEERSPIAGRDLLVILFAFTSRLHGIDWYYMVLRILKILKNAEYWSPRTPAIVSK